MISDIICREQLLIEHFKKVALYDPSEFVEFYIQNVYDNVQKITDWDKPVEDTFKFGLRLPYKNCVFTYHLTNDVDVCIFCEIGETDIFWWKIPVRKTKVLTTHTVFIENRQVYPAPIQVNYLLTKDYGLSKNWWWHPIKGVDEKNPVEKKEVRTFAEDSTDQILNYRAIITTTLLLLNCKNIETEKREPSKGMLKRCLKHNSLPPLSYHMIKVPGMYQPKNGENLEQYHQRLHTCRGHFKRYDNLFGKGIKGIFWWNPQIRGDKALGKIEKDYNVVANGNRTSISK